MAYSYGAVTVATSATLIIAPDSGRRGFTVKNNGSVVLYVGMDNLVTSANGLPLSPQDSFTQTGEQGTYKGGIWGAAASATTDVRFWSYTP